MAYKAKFRPSEVLRHGQWRPLEDMLEGHRAGQSAALEPAGI
jgi:arginyl-tRNA--protein-N-Asp/Glu arginylyltransferase